MDLFAAILWLAALLNTMLAGFLYGFAVIVMPGIRRLGGRDYLRAFAEMDGIIQRSHPLFVLLWAGSILSLLVAVGFGFTRLEGLELALLLSAGIASLLGIHLPTFTINIPLNNKLQSRALDSLSEEEVSGLCAEYNGRWTRANSFRTLVSSLVAAALLLLPFLLM